MGDRAFAFYFPVIERYVRDDLPNSEFDGIAWILAHDIAMHVPSDEPRVRALYLRVLDLCTFVLDSLRSLQEREDRSWSVDDVAAAWTELRAKIPSP